MNCVSWADSLPVQVRMAIRQPAAERRIHAAENPAFRPKRKRLDLFWHQGAPAADLYFPRRYG